MKRFVTFLCGVYLLGVAGSGPASYLDAWREMQAAVAANQHEKVVELGKTLSAEQPGDAGVWFLLGRSAFALKRYELAVSASEKAWGLGYRYMRIGRDQRQQS